MEIHDLLAGIAVLVGLVGIVLVFLPGIALQVVAVLLWSMEEGSVGGWAVFGMVLVLAMTATVLKYLFPHRRLSEAGVPGWLIFLAVAAAIVGLFVIPIVGAPIAFILTIYVFERARHGRERAWPSTWTALKAVLASIGIELTGGFLIVLVFMTGAILL